MRISFKKMFFSSLIIISSLCLISCERTIAPTPWDSKTIKHWESTDGSLKWGYLDEYYHSYGILIYNGEEMKFQFSSLNITDTYFLDINGDYEAIVGKVIQLEEEKFKLTIEEDYYFNGYFKEFILVPSSDDSFNKE